MCNQWLSETEGLGETSITMWVSNHKEVTEFSNLFQMSIWKKMTDNHLWISTVIRPTRSSFSRTQRVSCCITVLFLSMLSDAMFYQTDENVERPTLLEIGKLRFSLHEVWVSCISLLIVMPIITVITQIFQRIKSSETKVTVIPIKDEQRNTIQTNDGVSLYEVDKKYKKRNSIESLDSGVDFGASITNGEEQMDDGFEDSMNWRLKHLYKSMISFAQIKTPDHVNKERKVIDNNEKGLPRWCLGIAWLLVILGIIVPAFCVLLYSMEWGYDKARSWLAAFFLSIIESILMMDPIKVLIFIRMIFENKITG